MVMTLRKRVPTVSPLMESDTDSEIETPPKKIKTPKPTNRKESSDSESDLDSDSDKENEDSIEYEKIREQRIRENKERLEKLGIFSLASKVFNGRRKNPPQKKKRYPPLYPRQRSYDPSRRSARLKDVPRGKYLENERVLLDMGIAIPDAWKPEYYTKEHEKLLGDCEEQWILKTDGFEEDGERLYNPDGPPCHQCRQRTLGKLTYCGKCRSANGQLCGDCLYTRYGENVLEAVQNPTWSCPACRDICNCSRCRRSKGWQPINVPHSKVVGTGFKSVAHYLILTRRAGTTPKELDDVKIPMVDLTENETQAPQQDEGSDYSAESSESDCDDSENEDDSKGDKKNKEQQEPVEMQVGSESDEASKETDVAAEGDCVLSASQN